MELVTYYMRLRHCTGGPIERIDESMFNEVVMWMEKQRQMFSKPGNIHVFQTLVTSKSARKTTQSKE